MLYYNNFNLSRFRDWWRVVRTGRRWKEGVIVILRRLILPARFMCGHRARAVRLRRRFPPESRPCRTCVAGNTATTRRNTLPYTFNTWKFEFPYTVLISSCEHFKESYVMCRLTFV